MTGFPLGLACGGAVMAIAIALMILAAAFSRGDETPLRDPEALSERATTAEEVL